MAKQSKSKKPENIGKGKVTPVQIAFIVDRYLSDNNFTETRSTFRSEATSLISKTNVKEAPKSLMSLDDILDEYICLKEQKVILEQEKVRVEQEKMRVENLLQGMQSAMQAYNNSSNVLSPVTTKAITMSPPTDLNSLPNPYVGSPPGYATNITPTVTSIPWTTQTTTVEPTNFSTPSTSLPPQNKRKSARLASDAPTVPKRTRRQATTKAPSSAGTKAPLQARNSKTTQKRVKHDFSASHPTSQANTAVSCLVGGSSVRDSSVAKNLFKQSSPSHPSNSPSPKTPPQECNSQIDNSISPLEKSSVVNSTCNYTQDITPNCAVITSTETVTLSPTKHITCYSVERSHYFSAQSPAKSHLKRLGARDHVKGRLDFGGSDMAIGSNQMMISDVPTSEAAGDIFDMDMPNFDVFGPDFSLSEFLVDMELNCGQGTKTATNNCSGSTEESELGKSEAIETSSEYHSSVSEILCEKDMNVSGQNGSSSVKSIMKCVTITSPAKNRRSSALDQENLGTRS
ncbi:hypothetical protein ACHQM5_020013 [Ranunculus cassubicifolius]